VKIGRNLVTPYITWTFIVIGISGILMFFHLLQGYTEVVHEFLGLLFVIFAVFHVIINWKGLIKHFKKRMFIISFIVTLLFSGLFIYAGRGHGNHKRVIIQKLAKAPIGQTFEILEIDHSEAAAILNNNSITLGDSKTIEEIGLNNQKSPNDIIELILK